MSQAPRLPQYDHDLSGFVGDLRSVVFPTQEKAARYFGVNRSTITRYESGKHTPPVEYLACLAQLWLEHWGRDETARPELQKALLKQINRAAQDLREPPFADWAEVTDIATGYVAGQRRNQPPSGSVAAQPAPAAESPSPPPDLPFASFVELFELERAFAPRTALPLSPHAGRLSEAFDFVGVKWSNIFGFTVGVVRADARAEPELEAYSRRFIAFNDWVYWHRKELDVSFLAWAVAFTLGGVLCFVYEQGCSKTVVDFIGQQRKESPAYRQGGTSLGWSVQTSATTFSWTIDLAARRVYRHTGKHPDKLSYHTRQMLREMDFLEATFKKILGV